MRGDVVIVTVSIVLLIIAIVAATAVGRTIDCEFKRPWLSAAICILLVSCLALQLSMPELLSFVQRDASVMQWGQAYRLFTALWFQDGEVSGGAFNIAMLAVLGAIAEQVLRKVTWLSIYLIGGLTSEVVALDWQPVGAGNSLAYMSLAGALLGLAFGRPSYRGVRLVAGFGLVAGGLLCIRKDIHGAAIIIGFALLMLARIGFPGGEIRKTS